MGNKVLYLCNKTKKIWKMEKNKENEVLYYIQKLENNEINNVHTQKHIWRN